MKKMTLSSSARKITAVVALISLFMVNLVFSQQIMSFNLAIKQTQEHNKQIQDEVRQLKVNAAKYSSSQYLLKQAKELGFSENYSVVYLPSFETIAQK